MQCQCVTAFGASLETMDRPDLKPVGTEIVLKVVAAGVCHSDLHVREGGYDLGRGERLSFAERGMKLPHVLGHEPVGRIVETGPDVDPDLKLEENYLIYPWQGCGACEECVAGRENFCPTPRFAGIHVDGAYATQLKIPHSRYLFPIGDLAPELAAPLACSGLTAFSALKKIDETRKDAPVVIIGAGGLGLMAIGLLLAMGRTAPVVVDIDPAKREAAIKAGALVAVDGRAQDVQDQVTKAAGGQSAAVVDFVASEQTSVLGFNLLRKGGTLVLVGLFGGAAPWQLPMIPIKSATIRGSYMGSLVEMKELMDIVMSGSVPFLPTQTFPLGDADMVLNQLHEGRIVGRAVLLP